MRILVIDPFCGASGDMLVGALLDIGCDRDEIVGCMESIPGVSVRVRKVEKKEILATKVDVECAEEGKSYEEIEDVVNSHVSTELRSDVLSILRILWDAESRIHGEEMHKIGALDTIADVVGFVSGVRELKPSKILSTPPSVGGGVVKTPVGMLPSPSPATLEILRSHGIEYRGGPVDGELLTPTGAAILAHYAECVRSFPCVKAERVGYGAGSFDLALPNVLRIIDGELMEQFPREEIEVLETNVDDVTGEVLGNLIEELMRIGAKDVSIIPATMKKGRCGHVIKVICDPRDSCRIAEEIVRQTGSLGIRVMATKHRWIVPREIEEVDVPIGGKNYRARVKISKDMHGRILEVSPEFEDAKRISDELNVPLKEVMRIIEREGEKKFRS